ncbi:hypothetical protein CDL60_00920 [Roseateles noduli]|nr:hypothetical protein CDL60_00920 [Roseateles noduli]
MIDHIEIKNYKTIESLKLPLGRVNVLIGENGAGKSNILEAIALAGAAATEKLDNEFLSSRGIRVTRPQNMRPRFAGFNENDPISITVDMGEEGDAAYLLTNDNTPYSKWTAKSLPTIGLTADDFFRVIKSYVEVSSKSDTSRAMLTDLLKSLKEHSSAVESKNNLDEGAAKTSDATQKAFTFNLSIDKDLGKAFDQIVLKNSKFGDRLGSFIIYSPENSALRTLQREGQIEPLGINGEGLLRLLSVHLHDNQSSIDEIKQGLKVLGWFEDFRIVEDLNIGSLEVKDRYLDDQHAFFEASSTNEGFLFLLFYLLLFTSGHTPKFFAVDNIDASLNPKLCERLIRELVKVSKSSDKQVILTTHNPSILDGLNLDDDEQRLFVVSRSPSGKTRLKRIQKPATDPKSPQRLSDMFLRGLLGGLPKTF